MNIQPATPLAARGVISRPTPPARPTADTEQPLPIDSLEWSGRSTEPVSDLPPYVRSVNGVKSVSGGQILSYLKSGRNLLGWLAGSMAGVVYQRVIPPPIVCRKIAKEI